MSNTDPITQEEMMQLFGEAMPMEAVNLVWNSPGTMTVSEIRSGLWEISANKNDGIECAYVHLKGAATRLLMVLEARSEHAYPIAMESLERAIAEYRALK